MNRIAALPLLASIFLASPAFAFHRHLSPAQIREAYFIGRDGNRSGAFFSNYIHSPKLPDTGPDVQLIEFRTPYEQIAIRSRDHQWSNYSPPDAEKDYETLPHEVIVRVLIYETQTFFFPASNARPDTGGFTFRISQAARGIQYRSVTVDDVVPVGAGSLGSVGFDGIDVRLHFAASDFTSDDPVTVEVIAPTGQTCFTTFDLAALK